MNMNYDLFDKNIKFPLTPLTLTLTLTLKIYSYENKPIRNYLKYSWCMLNNKKQQKKKQLNKVFLQKNVTTLMQNSLEVVH